MHRHKIDKQANSTHGQAKGPRRASEDKLTTSHSALKATSAHRRTQVRLAAPARSHARTNERNEYDVLDGLTLPTSDT